MSELKTGVYQWRNLVNGKVYVGSTGRDFEHRKGQHITDLRRKVHKNKHLQSAWYKYGASNFEFSILEVVSIEGLSDEEADVALCSKEQHWMDVLRSTETRFGYNKRQKAHTNLGAKRTEAEKENISRKSKARWRDGAYKQRMIEAARVRCADPRYRTRLSERAKNRDPEINDRIAGTVKMLWQDEDYRNRVVAAHKKRSEDPENRQRLSEQSKKVWQAASYREQQAKTRGTTEWKEGQSKRSLTLWEDPAYREKRLENYKKAIANPEVKAKQSQKAKERWADPAYREKQAKAQAKAKEKKSESIRKHHADPMYRQERAKSLSAQWADPEKRAKRIAAIAAGIARKKAERLAAASLSQPTEAKCP